MEQALKAIWIDYGLEPECAPNSAHPLGIDVDVSDGAERTCKTVLTYPAPRCGLHIVTCEICGVRVGVSTAGRPDDPRSVKIACRITGDRQ